MRLARRSPASGRSTTDQRSRRVSRPTTMASIACSVCRPVNTPSAQRGSSRRAGAFACRPMRRFRPPSRTRRRLPVEAASRQVHHRRHPRRSTTPQCSTRMRSIRSGQQRSSSPRARFATVSTSTCSFEQSSRSKGGSSDRMGLSRACRSCSRGTRRWRRCASRISASRVPTAPSRATISSRPATTLWPRRRRRPTIRRSGRRHPSP